VRAEFMASQMVHFSSSMAFPEPGQIFMNGSMTWVVDPNGNGEIVEAVQAYPTPIVPTSATTSPILTLCRWVRRSIDNDDLIASIDRVTNRLVEWHLLVDSVLDWSTVSNETPALQEHQAAAAERPARPHHSRQPDSDLVITATPKGETVQH
jgi:hypothetical protein